MYAFSLVGRFIIFIAVVSKKIETHVHGVFVSILEYCCIFGKVEFSNEYDRLIGMHAFFNQW